MSERMRLRDEDRLPWLETVEPDAEPRSGLGRTVALILLALGLLAAILFGVLRWQGGRGAEIDGTLIAAPEGDYKIRPNDPGGLQVEGEGEAAVATSAGAGAAGGAVDLNAVPESPIASPRPPSPAASPASSAGRSAVAPVPGPGGKLEAAAPMGPSRINVPGVAGGSLVQLGAFPTEAAANAAWGGFAKRFGYLAALGKSVQPAEVSGRKVFRLRVDAGSANQAADICGRLRVAGEACSVTS